MSITLQWFGHASFCIADDDLTLYIDPWKITCAPKDATHVLISHSHHDHYSPEDIAKVAPNDAEIIGPTDVVEQHGRGHVLQPGQSLDFPNLRISAIPAYNFAKDFHPKHNHWLGFIIEIEHKRIYYAGDTDRIPEMDALKDIHLALLPVGGTYTMDAKQAADAAHAIKPLYAIPYHFGDIIGSHLDAERFASLSPCPVTILQPSDVHTF